MNWRQKVNRRLFVVEGGGGERVAGRISRARPFGRPCAASMQSRTMRSSLNGWKARSLSRARRRRAPGRSPSRAPSAAPRRSGNPRREAGRGPVICSQIGMSAPSSFECTGRAALPRVVDIVAVDPDQRRAMLDEPVGGRRRQERMPVAVAIGPPVPVPAGVDQHRLAGDVEPFERRRVDRDVLLPRLPDDDSGQVRERRTAEDRRGPCPRHSGGMANRDRCRYWRPCRFGRSGSSTRRHSSRPSLRESRSRRCAAPEGRDRSSCHARSHG